MTITSSSLAQGIQYKSIFLVFMLGFSVFHFEFDKGQDNNPGRLLQQRRPEYTI